MEFPKPVPVSKTRGCSGNRGRFPKPGVVLETGGSFQNRYRFPKVVVVSKTVRKSMPRPKSQGIKPPSLMTETFATQ
jgi:hypothetical protein